MHDLVGRARAVVEASWILTVALKKRGSGWVIAGWSRAEHERTRWLVGSAGCSRPVAPESPRCPSLVIAGSKDNTVPMHHALMLHTGTAGSKLVVEGADHAVMWAKPDEWWQRVTEFLNA